MVQIESAWPKYPDYEINLQHDDGIVGAKAALRAFGMPGGWPRPPRLPVSAERAQSLVDVLTRLGLDRSEGLASEPASHQFLQVGTRKQRDHPVAKNGRPCLDGRVDDAGEDPLDGESGQLR